MADVPQRSQPPEKRSSLAEMAAKAAQRSATSRPPPVGFAVPETSTVRPSSATPPSSGLNRPPDAGNASGDGSGLINLQRMQAAPSLTPAIRGVDSQRLAYPAARSELDNSPYEKKGRSRVVFAGVVIAVLGIGAAYGLAAKRGMSPLVATKSLFGSLKGGSDGAGSSQFSVKEEAPAKADSPATALPPGPKGIAPGSLPTTGAISPIVPTDILADTKAHSAKGGKAAPVAAAAPEAKEAPAPKAAAPAPQPDQPGLAGAIKKAVGPTEQAKEETAAPAQLVRSDIPEAPPQGAIQGALGSQRGATRSCVAGHDAPSRATIVFASTGKVQGVSVTGPAAGTAAEGCIKSALSRANVGPFQRSSFSVSTTISPP